MYALIDCNNFYANCERLFRPDLWGKPVVVLSNNDGCVVARSNEARDLGIPMGIPYFQVKTFCQKNKVYAFSSNYTLYGDISARVMHIIEQEWPHVEIYSIDEAFLDLRTLPAYHVDLFCNELNQKILRHTGIPTTIGIGTTKTLAKVAGYFAKKKLKIPVFNLINNEMHWLKLLPIGDVWGIGRQWEKKLHRFGILTAYDLAHASPQWIRNQFNIVLTRTAMELNSTICLELEFRKPKQSIMSSCSFGGVRGHFKEIDEAICHHCATAWAKMRSESLIAQHLSIFIRSNPFRKDLPQYSNSAGFTLIHATDDIRILTKYARLCLRAIYKKGIYYHKSGVLLSNLIDKTFTQHDLFHKPSFPSPQSEKLMTLLERVNNKYGPRTLRLAAEGFTKEWSMRRELKSPNYTTRWSELPLVR